MRMILLWLCICFEAVFPMILHVQTLSGQIYTLGMQASDTVSSVKQAIEKIEKRAFEPQKLIFNGKQLQDDQKLFDCNIMTGSTVHIVLRQVCMNLEHMQQPVEQDIKQLVILDAMKSLTDNQILFLLKFGDEMEKLNFVDFQMKDVPHWEILIQNYNLKEILEFPNASKVRRHEIWSQKENFEYSKFKEIIFDVTCQQLKFFLSLCNNDRNTMKTFIDGKEVLVGLQKVNRHDMLMKETKARDLNIQECVICMDNEATTQLCHANETSHQCVCVDCADKHCKVNVDLCPVCRQIITAKVKENFKL